MPHEDCVHCLRFVVVCCDLCLPSNHSHWHIKHKHLVICCETYNSTQFQTIARITTDFDRLNTSIIDPFRFPSNHSHWRIKHKHIVMFYETYNSTQTIARITTDFEWLNTSIIDPFRCTLILCTTLSILHPIIISHFAIFLLASSLIYWYPKLSSVTSLYLGMICSYKCVLYIYIFHMDGSWLSG